MKFRASIVVIILSVLKISAAEPKYPVSSIPEALKANAHTVVRFQKCDVTINSENSAEVYITDVKTILNKNGEENVKFIESYNPMMRISSLSGTVYNEAGEKIRSLGVNDAYDRSNMGYSLYDENRIKILDPKCLTYPMTVKYEYKLSFKQILFLPGIFLNELNTAFESVELNVNAPSTFQLKYIEYNMPQACTKRTEKGSTIYSWKLTNIPARTYEPFLQNNKPTTPTVKLVPVNFKIDDWAGNTDSWKNFGDWCYDLNKTKGNLPAETVLKIKELTANLSSETDKIKAVYEFMQKKTRYVSIQVGIGGWQPFAAEIVDKNSYGDCKALSNYTKALLEAAGIKSFYVLVNAGKNASDINPEFVSSQFNHAIVCVPVKNDTIWLETTSQTRPCGFSSDFTDDRWVLLVDSGNSRLVRTRVFNENENCINRHAEVILSAENTGEAKVSTNYIGLAYDDQLDIYLENQNDKKRDITERISIPNFVLNDFSLTEYRSATPVMTESLSLSLNNCFTSVNNNTYLLTLNLMNKQTSVPDKIRNRKNEVFIRRAYQENDTIIYHLPTGYAVSEVPEKIEYSNIFGKYSAHTTIKGNQICYIRHFSLKKGLHEPAEYQNLRLFFEDVVSADQLIIPLTKK